MLTLLLTAALAAPLGRDLHGQPVVVDADTVLVAWSIEDDATTLAALVRRADVVAVNIDPVEARSALRPWLRAHGLEVRVVVDPTGALAARLGLDRAAAVQVDGEGRIAAAWTSIAAVPAPVAAR